MEGGPAEQTARVLDNLKVIAEAAGSSLDRAVKVGVFLKDMNDFQAMNEVYARYFPAESPRAHNRRSGAAAARRPRGDRLDRSGLMKSARR